MAALAVLAIALPRARGVRFAAIILLVVAAIDVATVVSVRTVRTDFASRSRLHLDREAQQMRREIGSVESRLDAVAASVDLNASSTRAEQFRTLHHLPLPARSGARFVGPDDEVLAWWGDELRVNGDMSYGFDATSLYITRSRELTDPKGTLQLFQRIVNQPKSHSLLDPDDDWITGSIFHAGPLRGEPGSIRYVVERRPDSTLYVDLMPRSVMEVVATRDANGWHYSRMAVVPDHGATIDLLSP